MTPSTIKITFSQDLPIGAELGFDVSNNGGTWGVPTSYSHIFNWVNLRSSSFQVTKGTPTINPGERTAINFVEAFNLDTGGNQYTVTRVLNEVTIKAENAFLFIEFSVNGLLSLYENHESIEFEINNGNDAAFYIQSKNYEESSSIPCANVDLVVTTSELATEIITPVPIASNTNNPFTINVLRGQNLALQIKNANGDIVNELIQTPGLLNASNFNLQINNSPYGATLIISNVNSDQLELQYSLDNLVWQISNEYNGLAYGNYTLYIKDQLGCSTSKSFTVDEFGIQLAYFYISKANSIRFANRITWGDSENYKNDENTLSCEVDVELAYTEIQRFQSADIITTQFKSNYSSNIASVIKNDGVIINVPIIQKTNNIGIKAKMDARKYNIGLGKTGIYFVSGNTYNYDTNAIIDTYSLNGLLPEWAIAGNYFSIGNTFYLIEDVFFDETKNADVIVFTNNYTGIETNIIVGSIYNRFNYEVYEFSIDMVDYIDQKFRVKLENTSQNFTTITHLSEEIWCKVKHDKVLEIRYKNTTNTDVIYSTGIEHKIRIPYIKVSGKLDESSETHKTDTDTILLNADLYEIDEFEFEPCTKELWRKIMIALSHEKVLINGVGYVKNGNFNIEGALDDSNLYPLTASMIKTGNVYNSQSSGNLDFDSSQIEVPGIISTENGFLSY